MATANEVVRFMREHAYEFSNGFGYRDGVGAIRNFIGDVYDYFGEGEHGFIKDFRGNLAGGWIRLADGSVVQATTVCDGYGVVKGWDIHEA